MVRDTFDRQRQAMVENQLKARGVHNAAVLKVMGMVPRHRFIPSGSQVQSYEDGPQPIGYGQTISQPYMVALMVEALQLTGEGKVLEIGTGSGYQTAILAHRCETVISIERIPELAQQARQRLTELGYQNVTVLEGDGTIGHQDEAPYQGIIVSAASPDIPASLVRQLAEGGRLVIPTGSRSLQELQVVSKNKGKVDTRQVCGCVFVPLIGKEGWLE